MSNVAVTGPAGAPADRLQLHRPAAEGRAHQLLGDAARRQDVNLGFAADQAGTADDTVFTIGATAAATATNLQAAINSRLTAIGQGELRAASGLVAARQFFAGSVNNPVQRVAGPPFNTSTAYAPVGTRPTVTWYRGDDDATVTARDTQRAEIDTGTTISLGARANETALAGLHGGARHVPREDYPPGFASTQNRFDAASVVRSR